MKKRILSMIIALSFVFASLHVAYAGESDANNTEKTSFAFDGVQTKYLQFETKIPNQIKEFKDKGSANDHFRGYNNATVTPAVYTPYQAALLAFTTSASALAADERVYLTLKIEGYAETDKNNMAGGKVKIFYSSQGYPVKTLLDKSVYALSENKIAEGMTEFKIDVTSMVQQALADATAEDGIKTVMFIAEVDPLDTPVNQAGNKFIREDNEERTYIGGKIQYGEKAPALTVEEITPELTDIKINGEYLPGFESSKTEYTYDIPYSYQGIPDIEPVTKYPELTAVVEGPTEIPGNALITVSTPTGKTKTYTIALNRAVLSPDLTDIKIDGVSVDGFESSKEEYTHILSYNYNGIPEITVTKKDYDASEVIEIPSSIPGYATITVTTPDLKLRTYKIYLKRKDVLTELTDIKVDGTSLENFSSSKKEYTYYFADDYQGLPVIEAVKKDDNADVLVINPDIIPGICYIDVSNYAGEITTYKVNLRYENSKSNPTTIITPPVVKYTDASGAEIRTVPAETTVYATLDIKGLRNEENITFVTALYDDGFMIDKVSSRKQGNETSLTNTLNVTLPDVSKAKIKSFILNDYKNGKNILNCAELGSSNNNLKGLWYNNSLVDGFNKLKLNYILPELIPASVLNCPEFIFKSEDSGAKIEITYPVGFPGTVSVKTTASSGESKTYNVQLERKAAEITNFYMDYSGFNPNDNLKKYENIQNPQFSGTNEVISECTNPVAFFNDKKFIVKNFDDRFLGGTFISLPYNSLNPDKNSAMSNYLDKTGFITFDINRSATVYVSWAKDQSPEWLTDEGFIDVSNPGMNKAWTEDDKITDMKNTYMKHYEVPEWSETPVTVSLGSINTFTYWWIIVVFD